MERKPFKIKIISPAKINLSLDVTGVREDGYHTVDMVMQSLSLCDTVQISDSKSAGISIFCNYPYVPTDGRNIAHKAATLFFAETGVESPGIFLSIRKKIPVGAGMAGGSGNAAAVLFGLNRIFKTGLSLDQLAALGARCGADVPYCFYGGTMRAEGIGEVLTPLAPMPDCFVLLAKPQRGVATPRVYGLLDQMGIRVHPDTGHLIGALSESAAAVARRMGNVLEPVTGKLCGDIGILKETMLRGGALGAMMTGSGTTVFGIFDDEGKARAAAAEIRRRKRSYFTYVARPVHHGVCEKTISSDEESAERQV